MLFPHLSRLKYLFVICALFALTNCATLQLEAPKLSVLSIESPKTKGLDLTMDVHVKITNPNSVPLPIKGMSYALSLNGADLLQGATNQVPTIPAYGSSDVVLSLSTNLLSAPKFLMSLMGSSQQKIAYGLTGKIDLQGFLPSLAINERGEVPLK